MRHGSKGFMDCQEADCPSCARFIELNPIANKPKRYLYSRVGVNRATGLNDRDRMRRDRARRRAA